MELKDIFYINEKDWYKLQGWATLAYEEDKNEISGLMTAVPQEDGRIKVGDVAILKQENTGTNTELDADAVTEYKMKYAMKYQNPNMKFVWWHSHHTMGAFWSGTDENEIEAWKNTSYSLALVINLKEEYLFRVSFWQMNGLPIEQHIDTTLTIERKTPKIRITDGMKATYEDLCSNKTFNKVNTYYQGNLYSKNIMSNYKRINYYNKPNNENELLSEEAYMQALRKMENLQDSYVDGTCKLKEYKSEIKQMNKTCKNNKLPFKAKVIKGNKHEIMSKLMTTLPSELFEWDDEVEQEKAETIAWNDSFGGWYGN
tara:strand:+ start:11572 stop:12513 length:942 start_codon:yes stop_codon:yes gene_type:complete